MRVLALVKYGDLAASTRQRFVQFEPALREAGFHVDYSPLLDNRHVARLVVGERTPLWEMAASYWRRLRQLAKARSYDLLWVQYELFPYLPGSFERIAGLAGRPIICDFDDAIFHMYDAAPRSWVRFLLGRKLVPLLRRASACCCGNPYLRAYAARHCPLSIILPTVVDTDLYTPELDVPKRGEGLVIGWIGSPSTWELVRPHLPLLEELCRSHGVRVRVVGAGKAAEADRFPGLELVDWKEETEIEEVRRMEIGIMPVWDGPFQRGKSGYKLIQYMACGLPVVASPIGVNADIVTHGENGFLATSEDEWRSSLIALIENAQLRARMGAAGRRRAVDKYSLNAHAPRLVQLFHAVTAGGGAS